MKRIEERNFPYPILLDNGGDFINSSYNVSCNTDLSKDGKTLLLDFSFEIKCPFIEKLIEEKKVMPVVNIEQRTFRKMAPLTNQLSIEMSRLSPNHNLEIMPMLVARENYKFDYDESMDVIFSYFDDEFEVKRYQIVGYGNPIKCELPTNSKVGSIFTFSSIKDKTEIQKGYPYIITFETDVIDIKVLPKIFEQVTHSLSENMSFNKLVYSTFVYPAIQMALREIVEDYDNVKDKKWCIAITNKLSKDKKIVINSNTELTAQEVIEYSHIVLGSLIEDAFSDIENGGL